MNFCKQTLVVCCALGALVLASAMPVFGQCTVTNVNDSGAGSLRDCIANAASGDTINFASLTYPATITLTSGELDINTSLTISGPGASNLTVSGNFSSPVFSISSGTAVNISGLTIADGFNNTSNGGGIINSGNLTLSNSVVTGNNAQLAQAGLGGGIYSGGGSTLTVNNSTVSANSFGSAAIYGDSGSTLIVNNTTVSGNVNADGIDSFGSLTLTNSTVSGNSGSGVVPFTGSASVVFSTISGNGSNGIFETNSVTLTVEDTILANNSSGNCSFGDNATSGGYNLSSDNSCSSVFTATGDLNNTAAGLDPSGPQSNGGPTQTVLPLPGSPAICLGSPSPLPAGDTDQRGFPRPNTTYAGHSITTPCVDTGAVQTNYQSVQFTNAGSSGYSGRAGVAVNTPAAPIVSVTETAQNIGSVPVTLSFSGTGTASGLGPVATAAGTGATFNAITVNGVGSDTLSATLQITAPSVTPSVSIGTSPNAALNISPATTTTSINSLMPSPSLVGQAVTVSFAVSPAAPNTLTPTGIVTVSASTGESCTGSLPSTSCALTFQTAGTRNVTASYGGDANFAGSTSAGVSQTVNKGTATVTLGNLTVTYNGSPQSPTVTTTPANLRYTLSGAPQINAGSYAVTATIKDPNSTFVIQDFTLAVSPASQTIPSGHNATYTLTLGSVAGFSGTVSLGCSGAPPNSTCTISPGSVSLPGPATATATITLLPPKNVDHGTFTLTFTGTFTSGLTHTATASLTVK